ncbi:MAG: autotransporter-associated beta strand repeat-containing protein [Planctomycetia bacterium]|nr:autotransporter-associated beta strand repeat-containing protein [Planctomycetia bacterium]
MRRIIVQTAVIVGMAAGWSAFVSTSAHAATGTWNGAAAATWNATTTNWLDITGTPWDVTSGGLNSAVFNTASATPTVSGTVYVNAITFSQTATVSGGTITLAGIAPTITTSANATITSTLTGTSGLVKAGGSMLTLNASNGYTGATIINGGTLAVAASQATSGFTVNTGATLQSNANFVLQGKNITLDAGTFNNNNTYVEAGLITMTSGTISPINGGYFRANSGYVLNGANTISTGNAFINIDFGGSSSGVFDVQSGTTTLGRIQTGQNGSNATGLVKNGVGTLILGNVNTFTNKITVNAGTLQTNAAQALGNTSNAVIIADVSTAIVNLNGFNQSIGSLTGGGATGGNVDLGTNAILTVGGDNTSPTAYAGTISGSGTSGLTKVGTGSLTLTGASTYTGATTIAGSGTLNLGGGTSTGSLASTILNLGGGTLNYTRTGSQTQTFTTTNITAGVNAVSAVSGDILNLGTITRTAGAIDFSSVGAGTVAALAGSNVNGIIPSATFGSTWAVANGADTAITGLANGSYTLTSVAGTTAGNYSNANIDVNNSAGTLGGVITPSSLRFNAAAANTVTLAAGSNVMNSGIMATTAIGNNLSTISGGNLTGAASSDLVISQQNTSNGLTIASAIVNNTATGLIKSGAGLLTLTGVNNYTGNTIISAGTLDISGSGSVNAGNYSGAITDNGALTYSSSATQTLGGVISGTGSLTKSGGSTLTLTGVNTYTGTTTISAGTLQVGAGTTGSLGSGPVVNNGTLAFNSTNFTIPTTTGSGNLTATQTSGNMFLQGNITQSGSVTITTSAGLTSDGLRQSAADNSNHINTSITAASISITGMIGALNDGARTFTLDTSAVNGAIALNLQNGSTSRLYAVGILANTGTGSLTISGTANASGWGSTNSLTGALNISSTFSTGNLSLTAKAASSVTGNLTLSGATNTFASDPGVTLTISGNLLTSAANPAITKTGTGTVILSGANTYAGITTVSAGTLQVAKQVSLYNNTPSNWTATNINVKSGATLALNVDSAGTAGFTSAGLDTLLGNISVANTAAQGLQSGAILGFDTSTATGGTFTQGNLIANSTGANGGAIAVTKLGVGTLVFDKANTYTGATSISAGTLSLTGSLAGTAISTSSTGILNQSAAGVISGASTVTQGSSGLTSILAGANTYTGATSISAGVLNIQHATALGGTTNGTSVTGGAALQLQGTITVSAEALTLNGTGIISDGALRNISGNNSYAGVITLGSATRINSDSGTLTLDVASGNAIAATNQNVTFGGAGNITVADAIATGSGSLTKDGNGTLTLNTAQSSFSGGTIVNGGTLSLGRTGGTLATNSTLTVNTGATVSTTADNVFGYSVGDLGTLNIIGGTVDLSSGSGSLQNHFWNTQINMTGGLLKFSSNTLNELFNNVFTVNSSANQAQITSIAGGALRIRNSSTITFNVGDGAQAVDLLVDVPITTAGDTGIIKSGAGTMQLNKTNTYTGATVINGGTLSLGHATNTLSGAVTVNGATAALAIAGNSDTVGAVSLQNGGSIIGTGGTLTGASYAVESGSVSAILGGTNIALTKSTADTVILSGANTYTGATAISGGTLAIGNGGSGASISTTSGVVLSNNAAIAFNQSDSVTFSRTISGAGSLVKNGSGALTVSGSNAFVGSTTVSNGTLVMGHANALGNASNPLVLDAGTLNLNGNSLSVSSLSGSAGTVSNSSASTLAILTANASGNSTFSGVIQDGVGTVGLTKSGVGSLTLAGNNLYTGPTAISAGRLAVNGSLSRGLTVAANASLGGSGSIGGSITGDGQIGPGNSPGILTAVSLTPTALTSFAFEFTQTGAPTWGSASASGNDLLRLTAAGTPINGSLANTNIVDVFFGVSSISINDTFLGGFFTDKSVDFLTSIQNASFNYYVLGDSFGSNKSYNGKGYYSLSSSSLAGFTGVLATTVAAGVTNFASNPISTGQVTQFVIVPEPNAIALAGLGIGMAAWSIWKRKRIARRW